jgi:hypothetical protein
MPPTLLGVHRELLPGEAPRTVPSYSGSLDEDNRRPKRARPICLALWRERS